MIRGQRKTCASVGILRSAGRSGASLPPTLLDSSKACSARPANPGGEGDGERDLLRLRRDLRARRGRGVESSVPSVLGRPQNSERHKTYNRRKSNR